MKRVARRLLRFLLAGAIINVAVAWACAVYLDPRAFRVDSETGSLRRPAFDMNGLGVSIVLISRRQASNDVQGQTPGRNKIVARSDISGVFDARGWPTPSMWNDYVAEGGIAVGRVLQARGAIRTKLSPSNLGWIKFERAIPLKPLWPGFAINTIFYAAIVWVMLAGPGMIRRRVRRKRGQCAACGYSLQGTPDAERCPECAATARQSSTVTSQGAA